MFKKLKSLSVGKKIVLSAATLLVLAVASGASSKTPVKTISSVPTPPSPSTSSHTPKVESTYVKQETKTEVVAFTSSNLNDPTLAAGTKVTAIVGINGEKTLVYDVTYTNDIESARALRSETITKQPVNEVIKVGTKVARVTPAPAPKPSPSPTPTSPSSCDPNYSGACVPIASDVDCLGGGGNGPAYVQGPVKVIGTDIYKLDADHNGIGCD